MTPTPTRLSRTIGALLGVHAGDSLGATLEFAPWATIRSSYPTGLRSIIGGGPFNWPAGHATDDTDLTRAVLLAYRDGSAATATATASAAATTAAATTAADFDVVRAAADYMLQWYGGAWPGRTAGTPPVDIGNATVLGLRRYRASGDPRRAGAGAGQAGNGSLMRCVATGLFRAEREKRVRESMEISAVTHDDRRCTVSCAAYNEMVFALLAGRTPEEAVEAGLDLVGELDCKPVEEAINRGRLLQLQEIVEDGPGDELPGRAAGYVLESLILAVAAVLDPRPLVDVLVDVVRVGSDTDTNGAIAGGLLGVRDGAEALPEEWKEKLQFRKEFEEVALKLVESRES
ncbi:ADP-ribosylglycohydrolase [Glonium stellatum]|uniref:ADP-ribosylhydrolase ARH3 n=1 Tax=Glonium stellatum TaxID=574774 RepID=A0A8E2F6W9_9PEZI|nr:ADP-ribosylglycohydrolase [Glonium stellatum]